MASAYYTIEFDHEGKHYAGRLTPEIKSTGLSSWHVVLNEVFFGYLHKDNGHWEVTEQRPAGLVEAVGGLIDKESYQIHMI